MVVKEHQLLLRLKQIANLAKDSKFARLVHTPVKYLQAIFFRKFIYGFTRKGKEATATTFFDIAMQVVLPAGMDLYLLGAKTHDSEIRLAKFFIRELRSGNCFLDIGTHFGYYSLLAAQLVGERGKVIGIEASASIFKLYANNVKGIRQITPFHLAATAKNEMVSFYEFPILYSEYNTLSPEQFENAKWLKHNPYQKIDVEGKRVDQVFEEMELVVPHMVKIDVEGAEFEVLKGMQKIIEHGTAIIAMEYLIDDRINREHKKAVAFLTDYGYKTYLINELGQLEEKTIAEIDRFLQEQQLESDNIVFKK